MKTIFDLCKPRKDVLRDAVKESDFAADLAQILRLEAPMEYGDAAVFFANTHLTEGLQALLRKVCLRLTGKGGEAASIFRLDTQHGGGKTHSQIAHAANGMQGVPNWSAFIDAELVPRESVRIGAFDGEIADPANGRTLKGQARAFTPWGELAYALAGMEGYELVRASDVERTAPGTDAHPPRRAVGVPAQGSGPARRRATDPVPHLAVQGSGKCSRRYPRFHPRDRQGGKATPTPATGRARHSQIPF